MGWLGGLGLCDIERNVNQPFSYASCSIIFCGAYVDIVILNFMWNGTVLSR